MILTLVLIIPSSVHAQDEAGSSAMLKHPLLNSTALKIESKPASYELKKQTIKSVLQRYHSPLKDEDINEFMKQCTALEMNCYLLPSIFGVESQFCNAIAPGSNNCAGWGGGYIRFTSYKDGIKTISQGLKANYIGRGASSVESVGRIYASSGAWPQKVHNFLGIFEAEERKNQLLSAANDVQ